MTGHEEERIARLLRLLPPAPQGWVRAAQELPRVRAAIADLAARAEQDAAFRSRLLADLETALEAEGVEAVPSAVSALRRRLGAG